MKNTQKQFRVSVMTLALSACFGGVAWADETNVDEFIKPDSEVSVGVGVWSKDRKQQGSYDGMRDNDNPNLLLDADIAKRNDATGTWLLLEARNLGLDNRELRGEWLRQGDIGVSIEYNRLTRDLPQLFSTPLQGAGTVNQTVATAASAAALAAIPRQDLTLGTKREQTNFGFYKSLLPGLDLNVSFKNEDKTGQRPWSPGHSVHFVTEPINSTTRQLEVALSYSTKQFQLHGGYNGSWYENKNPLMVVNYAGAASATNPTYLSFPGDNEAHQWFLNGGYNFTPTTRATFKLEQSRATQNDSLPISSIAGAFTAFGTSASTIPFGSMPTKLDGKVDTTLMQFGLTSRPIKNLSLNANLRYHEVKDNTPIQIFSTRPTAPHYTRNSYKTVTGKLEGTYRFANFYSLTAGYEDKHRDRKHPLLANGVEKSIATPLRSDLDERTLKLELRRSLSDTANGSFSYLRSHRTGNGYKAAIVTNDAAPNGLTDIRNLTNPLHMADRDRDRFRFAVDWSPSDALSLQFNAEEGRDKYDPSGTMIDRLEKGTNRLYSVDAVYTASEVLKFNAWYAYDQSKAQQSHYRSSLAGGSSPGDPAFKNSDLEDAGNSLGLGVRWDVSSKVDFGADLEWTRTVSKYDQAIDLLPGSTIVSSPTNFSLGAPDITSKLLRFKLFSSYKLDKTSSLRVDLIHERWQTDDWTWTFANGSPFVYGGSATTDGTTVYTKPKENATFLGARYIYKFQ